MPLKIVNPYAANPTASKADQHKAVVQAWLQANPAKAAVTLAELREGLPTIASDLSREVVNEIAQRLGLQMTDRESPDT